MHLKIAQHFLITAIVLLSVFISKADAQQVTWGLRIGGSATDYVEDSHVDAAGNVFICGEFRGTNIDFDPGPGTALLSSNGGCDGFLAEYTAAGQYIRSFSIGGSNLDKINSIGTDNAGNIYITGYFRGANVDFDPSAAGTALLNSNGELGSDNGFGGDIFVAKYSPTGQYLWAFNVGGTSLGDNGLDLKVDGAGGVYVSGFFRENIDFDPSAAVHNLDANTGTAFLAKYNTSGVYQWALNVGAGNTDNVIYDSHLDPAGNIYVCGFFQGNNIDFDPSVAGTAILNCAGLLDGFVAKYTSTGQYLNVIQIGGPGYDAARGFVVDNASNIYVVGDFSNTVDFDPSPAVSNLNSNGSTDVFLVKYNAAGQLGWSFNVGSPGQELGWRIGTDNNNLFVTGSYFGVTDFNPAAAVDNVTSNGGADIFLAKYDFSGNYVCAFGIGSSADDYGYEILNTGTDAFYLSGFFQGTNTDFAPTASTYNMTSSGAEDGFLVKYLWPPNTLATGNVTGNTICASGTGQLIFTATAGTSPFSLSYTDGTTVYTQTNVVSGVPFNVQVNPTVTTNYTVTILQDAVRCSPINNPVGMSATITVTNGASVTAGNNVSICKGGNTQLNASGAQTYSWSPVTGLSNPNIANPIASPAVTTQYTLTGTTAAGCIGTAVVTVSIYPDPVITKSNDTAICKNTSVQLFLNGGQNYAWTPAATLNNAAIGNPVAAPASNTIYHVNFNDANGCSQTDSVLVNIRPDAIFTVSPASTLCAKDTVQLLATGGDTYNWQPATGLSNPGIASPRAFPGSTATYTVTITELVCGQSANLSTDITVNPLPVITATKSNDIDCSNNQSQLNATGAVTYNWTPAATLSNPISSQPVATPTVTTDYIVNGTDGNGCINADTVKVNVSNTGNGLYLLPNAFTPNGDGKNDCFGLLYWGIVTKLDLRIYNRWGEMVFHTTDPSACWNGTYKGTKLDSGVFVYTVKANATCQQEIFRKGIITLIR